MMSYSPLRVLQLVPSLQEGGTEQGALDMARYILERGGVCVVASSGGQRVCELEQAGIVHVALPLHRKTPWHMLGNAWVVSRLIREHGIQIVHARSRAPAWSGWLACLLVGQKRARFITTFHGTYGAGNVFKRWYNGVMLRGSVVIANSGFIKRHIHDTYAYPLERIVVAERGVDAAVFNPALYDAAARKRLREELRLPSGTPLVLMVGRLTRWKGQAVVLEALARLKDMDWVVAFAGGAKHEAYLEELKALAARFGIEGRVRWLGSRRDVPLLNAAADVAVSASIEPEAFGRVAIEAMAMETPIVASAHGGSLETVVDGETGYLVRVGDAGDLSDKLRVLLGDAALRARLGKAGRARVLARFTSLHTCEAEWAAYDRLMGLPQGS